MFTLEDKAFIRTILANPSELTAWLVYADWLDEHDNPLHAEFLRLEVRRGQLRNTDPEWYTVEARLRELRTALDPNWVAVFDRPKIENCEAVFQFKCPKRWESLKVINDPAVRHCSACQKNVYYCHTLPEAQDRARLGHCVAVQLDVLRYPGDLMPRRQALDDMLSELYPPNDGMLVGLIYEEPEPEAVPRRPWWKFW
ncbi:TIGR02996 domain-containing protein [Gemmata sp. G18]|uniref:TIGR02996 domain-containing protein n=1 Tax=Gemmata palustris TaxID=2822762 RepID=A0ABS5C337_9BACT|nr:TIGR02996 domain-containing protein [Gemmata palustris]MBP3960399.1 TIGR02996 domain-containing protein [Gemmata palustris]